jgi:hypothetical protein
MICETANQLDLLKKQLQALDTCRQRMELPRQQSEKEMKGHALFLESALEKTLSKMEDVEDQLRQHKCILLAILRNNS